MMRINLSWIGRMVIFAALIGGVCISGSDASADRKKQKYLKNTFPAGWQYQAGYTLWRLERGLGVSPKTWRRYVREKKWAQKKGQEGVADKLILKSLDWTVEELAALLDEFEDTVTFQPAGVGTEP